MLCAGVVLWLISQDRLQDRAAAAGCVTEGRAWGVLGARGCLVAHGRDGVHSVSVNDMAGRIEEQVRDQRETLRGRVHGSGRARAHPRVSLVLGWRAAAIPRFDSRARGRRDRRARKYAASARLDFADFRSGPSTGPTSPPALERAASPQRIDRRVERRA
jgi:hypothetical protein